MLNQVPAFLTSVSSTRACSSPRGSCCVATATPTAPSARPGSWSASCHQAKLPRKGSAESQSHSAAPGTSSSLLLTFRTNAAIQRPQQQPGKATKRSCAVTGSSADSHVVTMPTTSGSQPHSLQGSPVLKFRIQKG